MEKIVRNTISSDKHCIGCKKFNRDIMVTMVDEDKEFYDFFLTTEQAENLMESIKRNLINNYIN